MTADPLLDQLRTFAEKLAEQDIPLIIGGGYGLVLKANHVQQKGARTRVEEFPYTRSTADIDVFLSNEVIVDGNRTAAIRSALDELGYSPVPGAENYQFFRETIDGESSRRLKFDFLAAPVLGEDASKVKVDDRRIRPRGAAGRFLHAHISPEALTIEEYLLRLEIGVTDRSVEVFIPHPFSYVVLKLFALNDQFDKQEKGFGRHHAFDIYSTWAMMMKDEFEQAEQLRAKYSNSKVMQEAADIAASLFANENARGMIRLKEHARGANVELVESGEFLKDIGGLFTKRLGA